MIVFDKVGKGYRNRKGAVEWVLRGYSAVIRQGVSTAILAAPGSGKSTILSMVAGSEYPSEGNILRLGKVSWSVGSRSHMLIGLSCRQNLRFLSDLHGTNFEELCDFVASFGNLTQRTMNQEYRHITNESRHRFNIGAVLGIKFDFLLIDDDVNFGDGNFRRKTQQYILDNRDRTATFLVTSDVNVASRFCVAGGVLRDGHVRMYDTIAEAAHAFGGKGSRAA